MTDSVEDYIVLHSYQSIEPSIMDYINTDKVSIYRNFKNFFSQTSEPFLFKIKQWNIEELFICINSLHQVHASVTRLSRNYRI